MLKTKIFKILGLIFLLQISFIPELVLAIAFGHVGGVPANPDPEVELSKSYFIYNLSGGEIKEDEILVQNLAENTQRIMLTPVDSTVNNLGNFACETSVNPKDNIGAWVKFNLFTIKPIAKKDLNVYWENLAQKEKAKLLSTNAEEVATSTALFNVSETPDGIQIKNPEHKFIILDPLAEPTLATSSDLFIIPTSTADFVFPTSTEQLIVATTTGDLIVQLNGGQKKKVPFTISIPENIDVGEHAGGIIIEPILPPVKAEGSVMIIKTSVCVRIYETVPGEVTKKVKLVSFVLNSDEKNYIPTLKVKNESNISILSSVEMKMSGFGLKRKVKNEVSTSPEEASGKVTLADRLNIFKEQRQSGNNKLSTGAEVTIRQFFPKTYFGHFNFQAELAYDGNSGREILKTQKISIWVIPWRDLIILAIILVVLAVIISTWLILRRRRYSTKGWKLYTVALGDDLTSLADKYNLAWKVLAKVNKIKKPYILKVGQVVLVPESVELTAEAKITFKQIIREKIMSKLYSIIIVLLVVGLILVGGTWLYNKIFSQTSEMEEGNINQQIPPEPKIPDVNLNANAQLPIAPTSTEPIVSETTTTTPTSTTVAEVDKGIKISILNGSGISGQAKKIADILAEAGWLNTATGNADNFNYKNLTIRYQTNYLAQAEAIKQLFSVDYAVIKMEEKADLTAPVEIIIGK